MYQFLPLDGPQQRLYTPYPPSPTVHTLSLVFFEIRVAPLCQLLYTLARLPRRRAAPLPTTARFLTSTHVCSSAQSFDCAPAPPVSFREEFSA